MITITNNSVEYNAVYVESNITTHEIISEDKIIELTPIRFASMVYNLQGGF